MRYWKALAYVDIEIYLASYDILDRNQKNVGQNIFLIMRLIFWSL